MADSFLATTYEHDLATVDDGAELRTAIETVLTDAGWSDQGSNVWRSPDAARWIEVSLSVPAASKLQIDVDDYVARSFSGRRVGTVDTGQWSIHAGPYHLYLSGPDSNRWGFAGIVDHSPASQSSHNRDAFCGGPLTTSDGATSESFGRYLSWNEVAGEYSGVSSAPQRAGLMANAGAVSVTRFVTGIGYDWPNPMFGRVNVAGDMYLAGLWYQALCVNSDLNAGDEIQAAIGVGETGTFRVLSIPTFANAKLAARV